MLFHLQLTFFANDLIWVLSVIKCRDWGCWICSCSIWLQWFGKIWNCFVMFGDDAFSFRAPKGIFGGKHMQWWCLISVGSSLLVPRTTFICYSYSLNLFNLWLKFFEREWFFGALLAVVCLWSIFVAVTASQVFLPFFFFFFQVLTEAVQVSQQVYS